MKKILLLVCVLISFSGFAYAENFTAGDVIVVLKPGEDKISASSVKSSGIHASKLASFASASGARVIKTYDKLSVKENNLFALLHSDTKNAKDFANELLTNPEVIAACPNYIARTSRTPNDPSFGDCWGLDFINAPAAWNTTTGSQDIYVAVIDTGIDWTNPDLTDNTDRYLSINAISSSSSTSALDDEGHGSHVAGIIGAKGDNGIGIAGVNWNVKLIAIKALNSSGRGSISDIISGINYVTDLVDQGYNIAAVNLSLEWYEPTVPGHDNFVTHPFWRALKALDQTNKTVMVCAAGNYGQTVGSAAIDYEYDVYDKGDYVYPASYLGLNNFISVSALDMSGNLPSWSNKGASISAPGVDILSTYLQRSSSSSPTLYTEEGTSMAAPHVAGAAAILKAANPSKTAYQIKTAILRGGNLPKDSLFNLASSLQYQADTSTPAIGTEGDPYNDYTDYKPNDNYENDQNNTYVRSSSSGCNSLAVSIIALALVFGVRRKK